MSLTPFEPRVARGATADPRVSIVRPALSGPVTVSATGLLRGVSASTVTVPAEAALARVTFTSAADAERASRAFYTPRWNATGGVGVADGRITVAER